LLVASAQVKRNEAVTVERHIDRTVRVKPGKRKIRPGCACAGTGSNDLAVRLQGELGRKVVESGKIDHHPAICAEALVQGTVGIYPEDGEIKAVCGTGGLAGDQQFSVGLLQDGAPRMLIDSVSIETGFLDRQAAVLTKGRIEFAAWRSEGGSGGQ
jgi:hypothetical protein